MRIGVIFVAAALAAPALEGCAAGKAARATPTIVGTGLRATGNAALRAAGMEKAGLDTQISDASLEGRSTDDAHWSEEWVWRGDQD